MNPRNEQNFNILRSNNPAHRRNPYIAVATSAPRPHSQPRLQQGGFLHPIPEADLQPTGNSRKAESNHRGRGGAKICFLFCPSSLSILTENYREGQAKTLRAAHINITPPPRPLFRTSFPLSFPLRGFRSISLRQTRKTYSDSYGRPGAGSAASSRADGAVRDRRPCSVHRYAVL
jgi:hypothetical protein